MAVKRSKYKMNVYRTCKYIVFQRIWLCEEEQGMYLYSRDMYFRRTKKRDRKYAAKFGRQKQPDVKRIHVGKACEKEYID